MHEFGQQFQKSSTQSIDRLEAQLRQLVNIYRNEETRFYQPLTNSDISNSINLDQESCCFENQDSIQHTHLNLTKLQILKISLTFWQVIHFRKLNLSMNVILNLKLTIQFHFLIQY